MAAPNINKQIRSLLLLVGSIEALIAFSSIYVAGYIAFGGFESSADVLRTLAPAASIIALVVLLSLIAVGLYQFHQRIYYHEAAIRVLVGLAAGWLVLAGIFLAVPEVDVTRDMAVIAIVYAMVLVLLVRYVFMRNIDDNAFRYRTLIYGAGDRAASIADLRRRADRRGFQIVGRIPAPGDTVSDRTNLLQLANTSIAEIAAARGADEIIVAMDDRRGKLPLRDLLDARLRGIDVIDLVQFFEREAGKIRVDLVNPGWLIFSPGFRRSRWQRFVKRGLDTSVGALMLIAFAPVMLFIALAIKLEDGIRAPVLYRQCRVGRGGKPFDVLKFRSMSENAEREGEAIWAQKNDNRVTRVGAVIRKYRLDELPQLFNILRAEMSLVGPRPERPQFVEELQATIPYYAERHIVRPGLTGWAQLRYAYGASEEDATEKLQYELYYIKNQSLMLDIMILLQTVEVMLWGKGAR